MKAITVETFTQRLLKVAARYASRVGTPHASDHLAIALHAWPKNSKPTFCGVGPIEWGKSAESWFDVYVGPEQQHYHDLNIKLAQACRELDLPFTNMARCQGGLRERRTP